MKKKVLVEDLQEGMYVRELDRPWLDTPFLFQGFLLETAEQLAALRRYCRFVYIDPMQSTEDALKPKTASARQHPAAIASTQSRPRTRATSNAGSSIQHIRELSESTTPAGRLLNKLRINYPDQAKVEEELPQAEQTLAQASTAVREIFANIHANDILDGQKVKESISGMTESVIRNPDALLLLTRLKQKSTYVYDHALNVSVHLLAFGRHLGFPKEQMHILGAAGMLLDVGMAKLPGEILDKKGQLAQTEYEAMKGHVRLGIEIIHNSHGIAEKVAEIVAEHHEREDGSGYPLGLRSKQISIFGKMAAVVDCFQALINERPYAAACSPFEALQMLYDWRKDYFHEELVEQFIQCLGIYPVGTLVELNSGEVAIVLAHNRIRRLKPRVMVILDPDKKPYSSPIMLDLLNDPKAMGDEPYQIRRALAEGMYGINPRDYYL